MKCTQCGHSMEASRKTILDELGIEGAVITLEDIEERRCPKCGDREHAFPDMMALLHLIALRVARKPGRLSPGEINVLRNHLGLSVTDLARRLGVTRVAASRWESRTKPLPMKAASERLLRLLVTFPLSERAAGELEAWGVGDHRPLELRLRHERGAGWRERPAELPVKGRASRKSHRARGGAGRKSGAPS